MSYYAHAEPSSSKHNIFSFAVIGDLPYGVKVGEEDQNSQALISELNSNANLEWVVHVGDIKTGGASCSNEMLQDRLSRFKKLHKPFIYTPGDNEWTDCHRQLTGNFDPLERLAYLRDIFFKSAWAQQTRDTLNITQQATLRTGAETATFSRRYKQEDFVEHYYWQKNNIAFSTLHMVGSLNGKGKFSTFSKLTRSPAHDEEVAQREEAVLDWLRYSFNRAKEHNVAGLFLITHANPGLDLRWQDKQKPAFKFFIRALENELKNFDKPVVLAHGDSHYVRIDKPKLTGKHSPANFLRLESFGENNNAWIKVTADPHSKQVFSFAFFDNLR